MRRRLPAGVQHVHRRRLQLRRPHRRRRAGLIPTRCSASSTPSPPRRRRRWRRWRAGDPDAFERLLAPTVPLSAASSSGRRRQFYKTGVVFLAYLNGHQDHFVMLGGAQSMRRCPISSQSFRWPTPPALLEILNAPATAWRVLAAVRFRRLTALRSTAVSTSVRSTRRRSAIARPSRTVIESCRAPASAASVRGGAISPKPT